MGSERSVPCSQEPSIDPYPEPDLSTPYHPSLSKILFNIILSHRTSSSCWSLSFWRHINRNIFLAPCSFVTAWVFHPGSASDYSKKTLFANTPCCTDRGSDYTEEVNITSCLILIISPGVYNARPSINNYTSCKGVAPYNLANLSS
jgi:hypothetical protein